jgi:glutamate 5-kinase
MKRGKLIVIKIGTSSLTEPDGGISPRKIGRLVGQIGAVKGMGHQVAVVTSGAVAAGFRRLGYGGRPVTVAAKQAAAAVGQGLLIEEYAKRLLELGYVGAQLLLTKSDFADRRRYRNAHNTLAELLKRGAVPIINENDTVSIEELRFGDNDSLSANVAALLHADLLVLLTDVAGLYTDDPQKNPLARRVELVEHIDDVERMAMNTGGKTGTGGMKSKLAAARTAVMSGVPVLICSAEDDDILIKAADGTAEGTRFRARRKTLSTRMQWLAFHSGVSGALVADAGAVNALRSRHTSLLPSGILEVRGEFARGDVVEVTDEAGNTIGRGLTQYGSVDLDRAKGLTSAEIEQILPGSEPEAIHRDYWLGSEKIEDGRN